MGELILYTYFGLFVMYIAVFHIDSQIIYPYKPFKLKKQTNFISKYFIICKDKKRGMVSFAFVLEMIAHLLLIILSVFLIIAYCNNWYTIDGFTTVYRNIIVGIISVIFGVPGIIAISVHDYTLKKERKNDEKNGK